MRVTQKIKMDLARRENIQTIDVVQGDAYTRCVEISLYENGKKWNIPEDVSVVIAYRSKNSHGAYSTLPDDSEAYVIEENKITITMAPQAFSVAGHVGVTVSFLDSNENQITTFELIFNVSENSAVGAGTPEDYFNLKQWVGVGPLVVTMTLTSGAKVGTADHTHADILAAHNAGRDVICSINGKIVLPLTNINTSVAIFQGPNAGGTDRQVRFSPAWGKEAQVSNVEYASKSDLSDYAKTTDLTGFVQTADLDPYAKKTDLNSYAKSADLKPPLYVTLNNPNGTQWTADHTQAQIKEARDAGRNVMCVLDYQGKNIVPLINTLGSSATFRGPIYVYAERKIVDATVVITKGFDGIAQVTKEEYASKDDLTGYAKNTDLVGYELARPITNENYFDITVDGLISLRPEYRGAAKTEDYPYAISDNRVGQAGSKISDLPDVIVIPKNVDGIEVAGFQNGMFYCNHQVKKIVLPVTVKKLPNGFAREAIHLEAVDNAQQLEEIGSKAFQQTRIRGLVCPNLTSLGNEAFQYAYCLRYANLGKITNIPDSAFRHCSNLSEVNSDYVTSVGNFSFYGTRRLSDLPFAKKLKSLGDGAFWSSRCDLEELPADCEFGDLSSYKQFNPTEYWKGVSFTPCKVPLGSLFSQYDPQWADEEIKYTATDGTEYVYRDENGNPCTYAENGCALFTLMSIYSALMKVTFENPEEFFPVLEHAGMLGKDFRKHSTWIEIASEIGLGTELVTELTPESCKRIYDALQGGALLYRSTVGSFPNDVLINSGIEANVLAQGTHAILGYGITPDGEMLTSDSSVPSNRVGIYENHKTAWDIYKHGSNLCDCVIVRKPK